MSWRPISRAGVAAAVVAAAMPAAAGANAYEQVFQVYTVRGVVPACRFSSAMLERALRQANPDDIQYLGDSFGQAIQATLAQQGTGQCQPRRAREAVTHVVPATLPQVPAPPAGTAAATSAGLPLPLALLLACGAAGVLLAAGVALGRGRGWEPAWAAATRHSWREAEYRATETWLEFRDWLRGDREPRLRRPDER